jgi:hypothetical protein
MVIGRIGSSSLMAVRTRPQAEQRKTVVLMPAPYHAARGTSNSTAPTSSTRNVAPLASNGTANEATTTDANGTRTVHPPISGTAIVATLGAAVGATHSTAAGCPVASDPEVVLPVGARHETGVG